MSTDKLSPELVRRRVRAYGHVQGVFFRTETADRASTLDLAGWVRNVADGSVEAVIEGKPDAVDRLVEFMRTGPPDARVHRVDVSDEQPEQLRGFDVAPDSTSPSTDPRDTAPWS